MAATSTILGDTISSASCLVNGASYKVVAFMVTVRLVENKVKRIVGMDIVASLITMYNKLETRWRIQSVSLANSPSQDEDPCVCTTSFARVTAELRAPVAAPGIARAVFERAELNEELLALDGSMAKVAVCL